ncbi:hypothetical protein [Absidia glauca]|uniref:SURP motif domain-containing protein n=1 Tax=Absidia glauca TaxID=4829 RepID=A0A168MNJ7_ABSGL|nr:hypothetical protein [Absidia glauca]
MDHGGLAGIFTTKDIVLRVIAAGLQPDNCSVVRVMTPHPRCCLPSTTILEALKIMHDGHFLNLPVVDEDKHIIGLVDVLRLTYATLERINDIEGNGGEEGASKFWNNIAASGDHTTETDSAISDSLSQAANSHMFRSPSTTPQPDPMMMMHHSPSSPYAGHLDPMDNDDLIQPGDSASMVTRQQRQKDDNDMGSVLSSTVSTAMGGTFSFKFNYGSKTYRFRSSDHSFGDIRAIVRQKIMMDHLSLSQSYVAIQRQAKKSNPDSTEDEEDDKEEDEEDDSWLTISYVDDENDQVLMTTDADVQEAVQLTKKMGRDRVRLFVHDTLLESMPEPPSAQPTVAATPYTPSSPPPPPLQQQHTSSSSSTPSVSSSKPSPSVDDSSVSPPSRSASRQQKMKTRLNVRSNSTSDTDDDDDDGQDGTKRRDYAKEYNLPIPQELLLPAAVTFLGVVILGVFTISRLTGGMKNKACGFFLDSYGDWDARRRLNLELKFIIPGWKSRLNIYEPSRYTGMRRCDSASRCDSATNRSQFFPWAMTDRQERTRKSASAIEDASSSNDMMIFGYASKLYQDPVLAHKLTTGIVKEAILTTAANFFDLGEIRYDVRHLITDDFSSTESQPTVAASRKRQHSLEEEEDPAEYDMERYADLGAEEEKLLFYMDDTEDRSSCIEKHKQRRKRQRSMDPKKDKTIQYHYDYSAADPMTLTIAERSKDIQKTAQRYGIPLSSTIVLPPSQDPTNPAQSIDLIDKTAQTILHHAATQPLNVCEIQFQVRHCQDPRYDFLGKQHAYYHFYRHVLDYHRQRRPSAPVPRATFTNNAASSNNCGLVDYGSSDDDDDCQVVKQEELLPSSDILPVILKTANTVAKVGLDLEQKIKRLRRDDPTFGFLQPQHAYHPYYRRKLAELSSS